MDPMATLNDRMRHQEQKLTKIEYIAATVLAGMSYDTEHHPSASYARDAKPRAAYALEQAKALLAVLKSEGY